MSKFYDEWNKNKFSVYKSEEKTVLKLVEKMNDFNGELAKGIDGKTDVNGDHKGSWQGLSRPTLSDEGLKATVENIADVEIPNLKQNNININTNIENFKNKVNTDFEMLSKDIISNMETYKFDSINSSMGESDIEEDIIYPKDKLKLGTRTWAYYEGNDDYYPSVSMDKEGTLIFSGNAQIRSPLSYIDGMVEFAQLFHIDISSMEGIPLRGSFIGVADDDANNMTEIPFIIRTDGKILVKNLGEGSKYYNRIDLNSARVKLNGFGQTCIHKNIMSTIKKAQQYSLSSTQLIFFSDIHHNINSNRRYEQLKAMKKVGKYLDIKAFISGGDNIDEYPNKITAIQCHRDLYSNFKKDKFVYCNGNHDLNISNGVGNTIHPFNIKGYFNNSKVVWGGATKYYGYMDIEESKLRIIIFDSYETNFDSGEQVSAPPNVSVSQLDWHIKNSMNLVGTNINKVIFVSHTPPYEKITDEDFVLSNRLEIRQLLTRFKNGTGEFINQGGRDIICWLFGHEHRDRVVNLDGVTYVGNLLAAPIQVNYSEPGEEYKAYNRPYGTEFEFAFDIMSIVESERKVYFHRVGRKTVKGDRVISY